VRVRRSVGALACCACGVIAAAQTTPPQTPPQTPPVQTPPVTTPPQTADPVLLGNPVPQNPLEPKGFPSPPAKLATTAPVTPSKDLPPETSPLQVFKLLHSETSSSAGDIAELSGNVEFVYHGYHVFADHVMWDHTTHIGNLSGHARVLTGTTVIRGDQIIVDFDVKTYRAFTGEAQVAPNLIGGGIRDFLYVKGKESFGAEGEVRSYDGDLTTCNKERPHYDIEGDDVVIRPGRRAIFRRARIRLFGRTVLRLPFLSIPIDDRSYNNTPEVGQSPDEGYYIKTRWGIPLKGRNELQVRADYMQLLGVGLGANYLYRQRTSEGYIRAYGISGPGPMVSLQTEHRQLFKWGTLTFDTDYENNNYLTSPGTTLFSTKLQLEMPRRNGTTRLTFTRSDQNSSGFGTVNQAIDISNQQQLNKKLSVTTDINYTTTSQKSTASKSDAEQVDVQLKVTDDLDKATADFAYQRAIPIGSTPNFYGGSDQTPVLTLTSDAQRLMGKSFAAAFPFKASVSIGEFQDFTGDHISREAVDLTFQKYDTSKSRLHVDYTGEFKQGFYSDDTAEYILNGGTNISYKLGADTAATLRYNYLRPYGYSPLPVDNTGQTNLATLDLSYRPVSSLLVGAQTGYDLTRLQMQTGSPWQQLGVRSEWSPAKWFLLRSLETYDTIDQVWSSVRFDLAYKPGATLLTVGSQYDGIRKVWSIVNFYLANLKVGKTSLSANFSYNGYSNQFDSEQFNAIYDLHCAEAVFTYSQFNTGFRPGRTINFFIRIKAFPFDSGFGIGQRGQPLSYGTGSSY